MLIKQKLLIYNWVINYVCTYIDIRAQLKKSSQQL